MQSGSVKWWVLTAAILCGFFGVLPASAEPLPQTAPSAPQTQADTVPPKPVAQDSGSKDTGNKDSATSSKLSSKPHPGTTQARKSSTAAKPATGTAAHHPTSTAHRRRPVSPRVARLRQAFVASASLRPMAQQLLQDRTPAAYTGLDAYARAHAKEDAGALACRVVG